MSREMDDAMMMLGMLETMTVAESNAAADEVERQEHSRAALLALPLEAGVTTLPPCRHEAPLWLM